MNVVAPKSLKPPLKHSTILTKVQMVLCFKGGFDDLGAQTLIFVIEINFCRFDLFFVIEKKAARICFDQGPNGAMF